MNLRGTAWGTVVRSLSAVNPRYNESMDNSVKNS